MTAADRAYVHPEDRPSNVRTVPMWLRKMLTEGRCAYCVFSPATVVDHVIPVCAGGSNDPANLVGACERCNIEKGDRTPAEWLADIGMAVEKALLSRYIERPSPPARLLKPTIREQVEQWFDTADRAACWCPPEGEKFGVDPDTRRPVGSVRRWAYKQYRGPVSDDQNVPRDCTQGSTWRCVNPWHRETYDRPGHARACSTRPRSASTPPTDAGDMLASGLRG